MSKRRRKSSVNSDLAMGVLGGLARNGRGRLLLAVLVLVAVIAVGGYLLWSQGIFAPPPEATDPGTGDEAVAAQAGREVDTPVAGVGASNLGTGSEARSDWYELHFTNPAYPTNKANYNGGLDTYLVSLMNRATRTMDVAIYDFDLQNAADAMVAAKKRGVQVRMVTDSDTPGNTKDAEIQTAFKKLRDAAIPIVEDNRKPIMHNKFTVVDKEWVETGSWNYTIGDTYRLNNNMIIIRSPQLADNYSAEFEKMFTKKQFGPTKDKGVPHPQLTIGGARVQNYFASEDGVANHIMDTLKTAQKSIYFLAFSFTHDGIGSLMIDRSKAGVKVGGVFETRGSDTAYSEYGKMKTAGLEVYTDGNPYVMHHKVIIVDERTVIFGSFNFSDNADKDNDENLLIVDDPALAKAFKGEYDRMVEVAKNQPAKKK